LAPEVARNQRRIVVAQLRAQPGEPPDRSLRLDGERQDEQEYAVWIATQHDRRARAAGIADVLLPLGQPFECLEDRACGRAFGTPPIPASRVASSSRSSSVTLARASLGSIAASGGLNVVGRSAAISKDARSSEMGRASPSRASRVRGRLCSDMRLCCDALCRSILARES